MQNETTRPAPPGDLREYLTVLRRRRWSILLVCALVIGSAMFFSFRQTPVYRSETQVFVRPISTAAGLVAPVLNMENERALVDTASVATLAREALGLSESANDLLGGLDVSVETTTEILTIGYSDPDPARAQQLAGAFADAYILFRRQGAEDQLQTQIEAIGKELTTTRERLSGLESRIRRTSDGDLLDQLTATRNDLIVKQVELAQQQQGFRIALTALVQNGEVVQPAVLPTSPASPNHIRNGALALAVGLALGIGLAFLRERLDDRLAGREDLEEQAGAPVLAVVPKVPGWKKRDRTKLATLETPKGGAAEAYRTVRTNLQFIARNGDFKILEVTSPTLGEGKTTTTANLAVALAQSGKRVIAASCDLRKPRLHRFFGLENKVGVTSILSGEATLAQAAQRCGVDTLRVLATGPAPPNPAELLGSEEMDELIRDLRRFADFVVLDTAPVLAVSDALILAPLSDGILVVADAGMTTRGAVAHMREQLEQVGGKIVGGVLNNLDPTRAKYYPSYYRYYYTYRYRPEGEEKPPAGNGGRARVGDPEELWR